MSKLEVGSLYQLTKVRICLLLREPDAIFWIFVFPILLAGGLGLAFRNRPADVLPVAATTAQLARELANDSGLKVVTMGEANGNRALATGSILLLASPAPQGVLYKYDENLRTDKPGHVAHVDSFRSVLLRNPLPGDSATHRTGPPADGGSRCAAGKHAAGLELGAADRSAGNTPGVARGNLCHLSADLSMEIVV
jgi:hypothetical protein